MMPSNLVFVAGLCVLCGLKKVEANMPVLNDSWDRAYQKMFGNQEIGAYATMPMCRHAHASANTSTAKSNTSVSSSPSDIAETDKSVLQVSLTFQLLQVTHVSEKYETVSMTIAESTNWNDCRLGWNQSVSSAREITFVPTIFRHQNVFRPLIRILEEISPRPNEASETDVAIDRLGNVHVSREFETTISCSIYVLLYPFDIQLCFITVESPLPLRYLNLTYKRRRTVATESARLLGDGRYKPSNSWMVALLPPTRIRRIICEPATHSKCVREALQFKLLLRRHPFYQLISLMLPASLVVLISSCVFILPPTSGSKTDLCVTILLSLFMFTQLMYESMPDSGSTLPLLTLFFLAGILLVGVSCIISILTTVLSSTSNRRAVPKFLQKCVRNFSSVLMFDLAISNPLQPAQNKKSTKKKTSKVNSKREQTLRSDNLLAQDDDNKPLDCVTDRTMLSQRDAGTITLESIKCEIDPISWTVVGAFADRCFFLIHLCISVAIIIAFALYGYYPWYSYKDIDLDHNEWEHLCAQLKLQKDIHQDSICAGRY